MPGENAAEAMVWEVRLKQADGHMLSPLNLKSYGLGVRVGF